MCPLDLDSSVPDWLIDHPELFLPFRQFGIDDSCGGKSLRTAFRERGLDPEAALAQCLAGVRNAGPAPVPRSRRPRNE